MGIFNLFKRTKPLVIDLDAVQHRLTWFELQVAPFTYRFAIVPQQPILIGFGEGDAKHPPVTALIRYDEVPEVFERTVEEVDALVQQHKIFELKMFRAHQAFDDNLMKVPSVHLRFAYGDKRSWASAYRSNEVPPAVANLIRDTQAIGRGLIAKNQNKVMEPNAAMQALEPEQNTAKPAGAVVKIEVHRFGSITANGRNVSVEVLGRMLDELKKQNGEVWYTRDDSGREPPPVAAAVIQQVMDAIGSRQLPVRFQTQKY